MLLPLRWIRNTLMVLGGLVRLECRPHEDVTAADSLTSAGATADDSAIVERDDDAHPNVPVMATGVTSSFYSRQAYSC